MSLSSKDNLTYIDLTMWILQDFIAISNLEPDGTVIATRGSIEILSGAISQQQYKISGKCMADIGILTVQYYNSSTNIAIFVLQYRYCIFTAELNETL